MIDLSKFPRIDDAKFWEHSLIEQTLLECGFTKDNDTEPYKSVVSSYLAPVFDPNINIFTPVTIFQSCESFSTHSAWLDLEHRGLTQFSVAQQVVSYLLRLQCAQYDIHEKKYKNWVCLRRTHQHIERQMQD